MEQKENYEKCTKNSPLPPFSMLKSSNFDCIKATGGANRGERGEVFSSDMNSSGEILVPFYSVQDCPIF